ncbi:MAG: XRE family transcriptional regulator [bacterium]|nr:XRE family transcriptional regulator [bacterium]
MDLGNKIKERRILLNLTQEELADRCELTKSYISQLENNKTSPSLETLTNILEILGTDLSTFFHEEEDKQIVFNDNDYYVCDYKGYNITWLVPNSQTQAMEPILITLEEKQKTTEDMPHDGEEFGYVLEGEIFVYYGNTKKRVKKGESFYYKTDKVHYIESIKKSKVIWVSCPPNF